MLKSDSETLKEISIVILTANRPDMLRIALESVLRQTALSNVIELIVIENLGNRQSEKVCLEFPELPIKYYFRNPPIPPGYLSFKDALSHTNCELIAILFDDDWWIDYHLQYAITALTENQDAVAFYAPWITTSGKDKYFASILGSFITYFAAREAPVKNLLTLDLKDLLVASQISTSFHLSTLVANRNILVKAIECFSDGNPYDVDRLISVEFGKYGKVIYDQRPHVNVLIHESNESKRLKSNNEGKKWWINSNESLLRLAANEGIDIEYELSYRMREKKIDLVELSRHCYTGQLRYLIRKKLLRPLTPMAPLLILIKKIYLRLI